MAQAHSRSANYLDVTFIICDLMKQNLIISMAQSLQNVQQFLHKTYIVLSHAVTNTYIS